MYVGSLHPAYLAAPESMRWRGGLPALWQYLEEGSETIAPKWVGVVMPHGARVALRKHTDGKPRELTIFRREKFTTTDGPAKWTIELMTFRREFGILGWRAEHGMTKEGGPLCTFLEVTRTLDFFNQEEPQ